MGRHGYRLTMFRPISGLHAVNAEVDELIDKLRLGKRRDDLAGDLAYSEQRTLEIGMSLATNPSILLLDEPTAGMSREETAYIVELIRTVTEGRTLLVVEHDMNVVFTLCDRISVLVYGEVIASGLRDREPARPQRLGPLDDAQDHHGACHSDRRPRAAARRRSCR